MPQFQLPEAVCRAHPLGFCPLHKGFSLVCVIPSFRHLWERAEILWAGFDVLPPSCELLW